MCAPVDASAGESVLDRGLQQRAPLARREIVHRQPTEDFLMEEPRRVRGRSRNPVAGGSPPSGTRGKQVVLADAIVRSATACITACGGACGLKSIDSGDEHAGVEKTLMAIGSVSVFHDCRDQWLGGADRRGRSGHEPPPHLHQPGTATARGECRIRRGNAQLGPRGESRRSRTAAGITTRPALSMVVRMPSVYHFDHPRARVRPNQQRSARKWAA